MNRYVLCRSVLFIIHPWFQNVYLILDIRPGQLIDLIDNRDY